MITDSVDYCMLVNELHGMVKVMRMLIKAGSGLGFSFGVGTWKYGAFKGLK